MARLVTGLKALAERDADPYSFNRAAHLARLVTSL